MNYKEKLLASEFLKDYGDTLGSRGCNDFEFPNDGSLEDIQNFIKEYHEYNGGFDEFEDRIDEEDGNDREFLSTYLADFCVVGLLADKLKKETQCK